MHLEFTDYITIGRQLHGMTLFAIDRDHCKTGDNIENESFFIDDKVFSTSIALDEIVYKKPRERPTTRSSWARVLIATSSPVSPAQSPMFTTSYVPHAAHCTPGILLVRKRVEVLVKVVQHPNAPKGGLDRSWECVDLLTAVASASRT